MKNSNKISFSIKSRLLLIALLPAFLLCLILSYLAATNIQKGMQEEAFKGLRGAATALGQLYNTADPGAYTLEADGTVKKGDMVITDNYSLIDAYSASSNYALTLFYGDTRVSTSLTDSSGARLVGTKAGEEVIQQVLVEGKEYSDPEIVINGSPYYGYYIPVKQNDAIIGMLFAGIPSDEANAFINQKVATIAAVSVVILLAILIFGIVFAVSLSGNIKKAEKVISNLGKGMLNIQVDERSQNRTDELGVMMRELSALVTKLQTAIGNAKQSSKVLYDSGISLEEMANQCSVTTNEINHAVEDVSRGAMTQAEETETASASIADMGNIISEIVNSVDALGEASLNMKRASDESTVIINELSQSNDRTIEAINKIGMQVNTTNDSVQAIRQAIELITSIATETNLLSLNASIEAARAGEHGRGFAVVASEIQKLADESNRSAHEIEVIIDNLLNESANTVMVMDEVHAIMREQQEKLNQTKEKFVLVADGVNSTRTEAEVIETETTSCDAARAKIMDVIQNLSAISEENAASTEETNASMEELNATLNMLASAAKDLLDLATDLENDMAFFQM